MSCLYVHCLPWQETEGMLKIERAASSALGYGTSSVGLKGHQHNIRLELTTQHSILGDPYRSPMPQTLGP